jgi:hypothetical protein
VKINACSKYRATKLKKVKCNTHCCVFGAILTNHLPQLNVTWKKMQDHAKQLRKDSCTTISWVDASLSIMVVVMETKIISEVLKNVETRVVVGTDLALKDSKLCTPVKIITLASWV